MVGGGEIGAANVALRAAGIVASMSRKPRIRARWERDDGDPYGPSQEGLSVQVTARRRPIEVYEAGLEVRHGPRKRLRRRRSYVFELRSSTDKSLPVRLEDGDMLHFGWQLDHLIDELHDRIGDDRMTAQIRAFVRGSGSTYHARVKS